MTSPGHFGGHVPAERLWALTLRLSSGSRHGWTDALILSRVCRLLRREGGSGHPLRRFRCRTALFRKRQGAAAKEEGRVSGRATFLCFRGNKALHLRAVSPEANLIPRPRKVRKSPTVFFGPGDVFFFVLLFLRQKKKDPRAGSTPRRGRGTSPRRPQTAYPAFSPRGVKIPQDAKASCGRRSLV